MNYTSNISKPLLDWYAENRRQLPWRESSDPYKIWVTEIIMQQTRIEQGLAYFNRFLEKFPDIFHLANASEDEVLNIWQGLGYYSRARNMHKTAKKVVCDLQGIFPLTYNELLKLTGIGPYTAAAISSICGGEKKLALDGNLNRILARYFGIESLAGSSDFKTQIDSIESELLHDVHAGDINQAFMDLGSLVCKPTPDCNSCPLGNTCYARVFQQTHLLPAKKPKTKVRNRYFYYLIATSPENNILVKKRENNDIWQGLYEFPLIEANESLSLLQLKEANSFYEVLQAEKFHLGKVSKLIKHQLSHQTLYTRFIRVFLNDDIQMKPFNLIPLESLTHFPLPRLLDRFLEENEDFL
jgi:A/G-specific adenine glycosylase